MPRKVRQLKADLRRVGCREEPGRGKGSHSYWTHPDVPAVRVNLAGNDGDDAKDYQERDVRRALEQVRQAREQARRQP